MDRKRRAPAAANPAPAGSRENAADPATAPRKTAAKTAAKTAVKPPRPRAQAAPAAPADDEFGPRGKRLGLPEEGPGSLAPTGRRLAALLVDWMLSYLIALAFLGGGRLNATGTSFGTLAVFAAENLLLLSTLGYTVGKRIFGLRVVSVTRPHLTPLSVVLRTLMLCMVFPAAVWDRDGRGLHDKAVGTAVVRA